MFRLTYIHIASHFSPNFYTILIQVKACSWIYVTRKSNPLPITYIYHSKNITKVYPSLFPLPPPSKASVIVVWCKSNFGSASLSLILKFNVVFCDAALDFWMPNRNFLPRNSSPIASTTYIYTFNRHNANLYTHTFIPFRSNGKSHQPQHHISPIPTRLFLFMQHQSALRHISISTKKHITNPYTTTTYTVFKSHTLNIITSRKLNSTHIYLMYLKIIKYKCIHMREIYISRCKWIIGQSNVRLTWHFWQTSFMHSRILFGRKRIFHCNK